MKKKNILLGFAAFMLVSLTSCSFNFNTIPGGNETIVPTIPDHVHNEEETIVPPTCKAEGYSVFKCKECGNERIGNKVSPLGHKNDEIKSEKVVPPTCTADGSHDAVIYCKVCGDEVKRTTVTDKAIGHEYNHNPGYKAPTCTEEGISYGGTCIRCGAEDTVGTVPALGHDYVYERTVTLSSGHKQDIYGCTRCDDEFIGGLVVNQSVTYEYNQFKTNPIFASHKDAYMAMYTKFDEDCKAVLASDDDYEYTTYGGYKKTKVSSFNFGKYGLSGTEAGAILFSFVSANPQYYFLKSEYLTTGNDIILIMDDSCMKGLARETIQKNILKTTIEFTESVKGLPLSKDQLAKKIHDFICNKIDYAYDSPGHPSEKHYAHTIIGLFDNNNATNGVCECYAKSYLYFSYLMNLNSIIVSGKGGDADGNGNIGGHAWNYTEINGKWYGVDVTWDDQSSIIYNYFLAGSPKMNDQHYPGTAVFGEEYFQVPLPTLQINNFE